MSDLSLKIAPLINLTPLVTAVSKIFSKSLFESVIRGRIGSILTTHWISDFVNFSITLNKESNVGVPGSIILFTSFAGSNRPHYEIYQNIVCVIKSLQLLSTCK
jgi:hypothetical protein